MRRAVLAAALVFASGALLLSFSRFAPNTAAKPAGGDFLERAVTVDGTEYRYQVFVPRNLARSAESTSVVLFLHGAGERGDDGVRQTSRGLPTRLDSDPEFPAVVVMPQCRRGAWWGEPAMEALVFRALEETMKEFRGDPERVYLTGLSMGGYGAWAFAYKFPERFAAVVPVCGGVSSRRGFPPPSWHPASRNPGDPFTETASRIRDVPVWAFHGDADPRVPVSESRELVEALQAVGGDVRYTEYPGVRHNSWDRAYAEQDLYDWMFSQRRGSR